MRLGLALDLVKIDQRILGPHPVSNRAKPFAGDVGRRAVRQMAAGGERHAENCVTRLEQRQIHRLVGGRAGMRLDIGEAAVE